MWPDLLTHVRQIVTETVTLRRWEQEVDDGFDRLYAVKLAKAKRGSRR